MKSPIIIVNFKTYEEGTGENSVNIAKACRDVGEESGINIAVAPQTCDIYRISSQIEDISIYSQHIDGVGPGSFTGHTFSSGIQSAGATGTLINHSEKRLKLADIESAVSVAKKSELTSVICTNNVLTSAAAASFGPDYVAVEPPELIGSGIPVSEANPDIVRDTVTGVQNINSDVKVLCGAGISQGKDLKAALELGSHGVLLASGIVKSNEPKKALENLISLI